MDLISSLHLESSDNAPNAPLYNARNGLSLIVTGSDIKVALAIDSLFLSIGTSPNTRCSSQRKDPNSSSFLAHFLILFALSHKQTPSLCLHQFHSPCCLLRKWKVFLEWSDFSDWIYYWISFRILDAFVINLFSSQYSLCISSWNLKSISSQCS